MTSEKRKRSENNVKMLNLLDAPRTWFLYNKNEYSVSEAPPDVFDAWIRQHVEEITGVNTTVWEIYDRWFIIDACIEEDVLFLQDMGDGNQSIEEKASDDSSDSEVKEEEKASDLTSELEEYIWPEPA